MTPTQRSVLVALAITCACTSDLGAGETTSDLGAGETSAGTDGGPAPELPDPVALGGCTMSPGELYGDAVRHAVIECPRASGVRVAASDAGVMMTSNSADSAWLFHTGPDGFEIEVLPDEFVNSETLLSQDDAGNVAFVVSKFEEEGWDGSRGSPQYLVRDGDSWSIEPTISDSVRLESFELDAAGNPTIWFSDRTNYALHRLTRGGSDQWLAEPIADADADDRYNLAIDDDELHYYYAPAGAYHYQLAVNDNGSLSPVSSFTQYLEHYQPVPPPRPSSPESGPRALVVQQAKDGLSLRGSEGFVVEIPGTSLAAPSCPYSPADCEQSCHDLGGGMRPEAFGVTRATDGSVWIGWVTVSNDHWKVYAEACDEPDDDSSCACVINGIMDDNDSHNFHLARVIGEDVEEILTLEISGTNGPYALRGIDLRAYGDRLAVGLRSNPSHALDAVFHLLDIDIGD